MTGLLVDGLIVVLLLAVLGFGVGLHGQLRRLRKDGAELEQLIGALTHATDCAQAALAGLRASAAEAGTRLERGCEDAVRLLDELRVLTGRADQEAERLFQAIQSARVPESPSTRTAAQGADPRQEPDAAQGVLAKAELLRALRTLR